MDHLNIRSSGRRNGLSLIEIMVSILVLSVGLLGVLAVIPYGGFQLARMKDANYSSTLAQNAFSTIKANHWYLPHKPGQTGMQNWSELLSAARDSLVHNEGVYEWVAYQDVADTSLAIAWARNNAPPGTAAQFMVRSAGKYYVDLTYPIMIDPVGSIPTRLFRNSSKPVMLSDMANNNALFYSPRPYTVTAYSALSNLNLPLYRMMWPTYSYDGYTTFLVPSGVQHFFYSHDDITYGLSDVERSGDFRPRVVRESSGTELSSLHNIGLFYDELYPYIYVPSRNNANVVQSGIRGNLELPVPVIAENIGYTGQYSWMAMLQLYPATEPFCDCPVSDIQKADVDVVIFKGRSKDSSRSLVDLSSGRSVSTPIYDTITCDAVLQSNGIYGGMFKLTPQLTNGVSLGEFMERLAMTSHILLIGDEDVPINYNGTWVYRKFARWYKVAYFKENNGVIVANLSGPTCPEKWSTLYDYDNNPNVWNDNPIHSTTVKAVIFPHVVNVYSRTFTVSN